MFTLTSTSPTPSMRAAALVAPNSPTSVEARPLIELIVRLEIVAIFGVAPLLLPLKVAVNGLAVVPMGVQFG